MCFLYCQMYLLIIYYAFRHLDYMIMIILEGYSDVVCVDL